jgi:hypothetical protein
MDSQASTVIAGPALQSSSFSCNFPRITEDRNVTDKKQSALQRSTCPAPFFCWKDGFTFVCRNNSKQMKGARKQKDNFLFVT